MKNPKILLIDDFDTVVRIIRNILNDLDYNNNISAKNGEEAIEAKVDQYIIKPFTSAMLKEKIDLAINNPKKILAQMKENVSELM